MFALTYFVKNFNLKLRYKNVFGRMSRYVFNADYITHNSANVQQDSPGNSLMYKVRLFISC